MRTAEQKSVQRKKASTLSKATSLESVPVESIQRSMGNQGLSEYLFSSFQVSDPKDASEQEAEHTADRVMSEGSAMGEIQCAPSREEISCVEESAPAGAEAFSGSASTAMPQSVQTKMETAFGRSFDQVSVHHDAQADTLSRSLHADAFTKGNDIYFRQDAYDMSSQKGQHLLAHELTHVAQNDGGLHRTPHEGELQRAPTTSEEKTELQKLAESDVLFCKFVELLGNKSSRDVIKDAAAVKLVPEPTQNDGIGIATEMLEHVSGGIDKEKDKQEDSKLGSAIFSTAAAGASAASTGLDIAQKSKGKKDKQEKLDQLFGTGTDRQTASMSGKEITQILGNITGSAASATGAGASITKAAGKEKGAKITGLVGDSLTVVSDAIGIGLDSADLDKARTNNNKAREQICNLVDKAADYEKDGQKKQKIKDLSSKVSSNKNENGALEFNAAVDDVLGLTLESKSVIALKRAKMLNSTRQVSREMKNEKGWDLGGKVFGMLNDITSVVGDSFDLGNNEAVSSVLSTIGGFASIVGGLFDGAKAIYNQKQKENRENNAEPYAEGVLEDLADSLNGANATVTADELKGNLTDSGKRESGEIFSDCYQSLEAGNVDMLDFLVGVNAKDAAAVKKAVIDGYVNH